MKIVAKTDQGKSEKTIRTHLLRESFPAVLFGLLSATAWEARQAEALPARLPSR